ncbi:NB-ARC domain-containing protein [Streptomyces sp. NBC_00724]|uniref:NB-ARC domain-containing protein n=1 Tax=Streptomyces sp. NBC_00724 TaxID=2975812 RepID=UPI002ED640BA|nr:NB-ARC domain-containing protein [Streptomyces sp. NBC_00724]
MANNTFNGPAFIQIGDGNQQNNYLALPSQRLREPPPVKRVDDWVVGRAEADEVIAAVCSQAGGAVGITTALEGAGGFGKTTLAQIVCASHQVRQHFAERVYVVAMGRDVRLKADIAKKVGEATRFITEDVTPFDDPDLAGAHLGRLLDQHSDHRFLLVIDDVWNEEQLSPFLMGGHRCVRLVTTRRPESLPPAAKRIRVDEMSTDQARKVLTWKLPPIPEETIRGLLHVTGRWPLLLRLTNRVIAAQWDTGADPATAAQGVLEQLAKRGPVGVDDLAASSGPEGPAQRKELLDDPDQRKKLVRATVEAATKLLPPDREQRLAELAIFAGSEAIPVSVAARLWQATGELGELQARQVCKALSDLSLVAVDRSEGGRLILHDVIRDYLRGELGQERLMALNSAFVSAVEADLPRAEPLSVSAPQPLAAWWELTEGYLLDHAIGHLLDAHRTEVAEAVACDLRWVERRLHHRGPNAPTADCARIPISTAAARARDLSRVAHLLGPAEPAHALTTILHSRLAPLSNWRDQVMARQGQFNQPALVNHWTPPDLPSSALQRTLTGHAFGMAVAIAPDGTWLAAGGQRFRGGETVRIWDLASGKQTAALSGDRGYVDNVVIAPDGTWLAMEVYAGVGIWDLASGEQTATLIGHTGGVTGLAIAPDGTWLASVGWDRSVRIWDPASGEQTATFTGHTDQVNGVAIAPDGTWLATTSSDGTVRIWDRASGKHTTIHTGHTDRVAPVAIAPDGTWLATTSSDGTVQIWNRASRRHSANLIRHADRVKAVAIAPDGTWLATASLDGTVRTWDRASGKHTATLIGHAGPVNGVAIAPDGTWLATVGSDGTVRIWDRPSGEQTSALTGHAGSVEAVAIAPDDTWLATANNATGGPGGEVRIWDRASGEQTATLTGHTDSVTSVAIAPDGSWLATGGSDGRARIWDRASRKQTANLPVLLPDWQTGETGSVTGVPIAPNGKWLATANGSDWSVGIWNRARGERTASLSGETGSVKAVAIAPDGTWLAMADGGTVRMWDLTFRKQTAALTGHTGSVNAVAIAPDGTWLATGDRGTVRIWDRASGEQTATLTGHTDSVTSVAIAPDGTRIATTSLDATVHIWDRASAHVLTMMRTEGRLLSCAWTSDGFGLVVGGEQGVYSYEFRPGTPDA